MSEKHLAITSVPVQEWEEPYSEDEALRNGTIFHELDKPFFAVGLQTGNCMGNPGMQPAAERNRNTAPGQFPGPASGQSKEEQLLMKITKTGFFLDDLTLFLDTHEDDRQAMAKYREKLQEYKELKRQFAAECYPLTRECIGGCAGDETPSFCWLKGPMPWEGACEVCGTTKNDCSFL